MSRCSHAALRNNGLTACLLFILASHYGYAQTVTPTEFLLAACGDWSNGSLACTLPPGSSWRLITAPAAILPQASQFAAAADGDQLTGSPDAASPSPPLSPLPPTLDLGSRSTLFSVPANGSLELRGLRITGALLPSSPFPLPPSALLSLSAFRMGPGARLRLVDTIITTPSCAALSLQQTFACAASPSPNFTVTPASLYLHRLMTATLDATNVTLLCSGAAAPFPCLAQSVFSGPDLMAAVSNAQAHVSAAAAAFGRSGAALFLHIARSIVLAEGAPQHSDGSSCADSTGGATGPELDDDPEGLVASTPLPLQSACATPLEMRLVLSGSPASDPPTVLDLAGTSSLFIVRPNMGSVEIRHLTLRNTPPGPDGWLPYSLLRLPLWTFGFQRKLLGTPYRDVLVVEDSILELPPAEMATWFGDAQIPLPPRLAPHYCINGIQGIFTARFMSQVPGADEQLLLASLEGQSHLFVYRRLQLRTAWRAPSPLPKTAAAGAPAGPLPVSMGDQDDGPSVCLLLAPGVPAPYPQGEVSVVRGSAVWPSQLDALPAASVLPGGRMPIRTTAVCSDLTLLVSNDSLHAPSYGQAQTKVLMPSMLLGEPLSLRLLDVGGVTSGFLIQGPDAALTLRHLLLVGLPAAGPWLKVALVPRPPPRPPNPRPPPSTLALGPSPPRPPPMVKTVGPQLGSSGGSSITGRRHLQASSSERSARSLSVEQQYGADGSSSSSSVTQGQPPSLANFTSCLWTFDFDRSPEALAADMAGGGEGGRPAGLPRLFLDSVLLVVPQPELELLSRVWLHAAALRNGSLVFGPDTDAGLAGRLGAMVRDSQLEAAVTPGLPDAGAQGTSSSGASSGAALSFAHLSWCGLFGRNVTFTASTGQSEAAPIALLISGLGMPQQIAKPGVRRFVLPRVTLVTPPPPPSPLSPPIPAREGGVASVESASSAAAPPQPRPPRLPPDFRPSAGPAPSLNTAADGSSTPSLSTDVGSRPFPTPNNLVAVEPGNSGAAPHRASAGAAHVLAIALPCAVTLVAAALIAATVWVWRRRGDSPCTPCLASAASAAAASRVARGPSSNGAFLEAGAASSSHPGACWARKEGVASVKGAEDGSSNGPKSIWSVLRSAKWVRRGSRGRSMRGAGPCGGQQLHGTSSGLGVLSLSGASSSAACGARHLSSVNRAMVGMMVAMEDGRLQLAASNKLADDEAQSDALAAKDLGRAARGWGRVGTPDGSGDGGGGGAAAFAMAGSQAHRPSGKPAAAAAAAARLEAYSQSPPALTVSAELGRGAQGVVYRGLWRGLDVAVKSVLFQHCTGAGNFKDPRARRAVEEAAIATSLSHPNIVATYAYQLQPLQTQEGTGPDANSSASRPFSLMGTSDDPVGAVGASGRGEASTVPTLGSLGLEAEVWKLTLIQELCDANSLRHCLESGRLAAAMVLGAEAAGLGGRAEPNAQLGMPLPRPAAAAAAQPSLTSAAESASPLQPLSARVILLLARDVARGMAHLHSRGVVHADLSSSNVLLQSRAGRTRSATGAAAGTAEDSEVTAGAASPRAQQGAGAAELGYVAKVCDFGLSGRLDSEADDTHLSGPARRSSAYSAPELVMHGRASPAGDVYAFAVVLWELALGLPLPSALARPESHALRKWLAEEARVQGSFFRGSQGSADAQQQPATETQPDLAALTGAAPIAVASVAASPPVEVSALPPGLLWWTEGTPAGVAALAAECLQPQPRSRPSFEAVLGRVEAMLRALEEGSSSGAGGLGSHTNVGGTAGGPARLSAFRLPFAGGMAAWLGLQPKGPRLPQPQLQ